MKKILAIFFIILLTSNIAFASTIFKAQTLYPINDKNGGGYINKNGKVILDQKYSFAFRFVGDYAIVQDKNLKYGIIDKKGNVVINFEYENMDNLSEDFVIYKKGGKYGYINIKKNKKSEALFDDTKKFQEGLMAVRTGDKWGFINKKGDFAIEPKYYDVSNFNERLSAISSAKGKIDGYINKKGRIKISFSDNTLAPREFVGGLAPIIKEGEKSCSYINKKGKIIIDNKKISPINIYCGSFYEGLAVFYIDENPKEIITGYINKKGQAKFAMVFSVPDGVSDGEFSAFDDFSSNMAQFTIDYKTGYINKDFKVIIPPIYEFARDFSGDLAYVKFEDKEGYINKKGQWVWSKEREGM